MPKATGSVAVRQARCSFCLRESGAASWLYETLKLGTTPAMRCRSCSLSSSSAFCCGVSGGVSVCTPATGTGASGTEVEGDAEGKVGVAGVCAWAAPAKQSARSDAGSRQRRTEKCHACPCCRMGSIACPLARFSHRDRVRGAYYCNNCRSPSWQSFWQTIPNGMLSHKFTLNPAAFCPTAAAKGSPCL